MSLFAVVVVWDCDFDGGGEIGQERRAVLPAIAERRSKLFLHLARSQAVTDVFTIITA